MCNSLEDIPNWTRTRQRQPEKHLFSHIPPQPCQTSKQTHGHAERPAQHPPAWTHLVLGARREQGHTCALFPLPSLWQWVPTLSCTGVVGGERFPKCSASPSYGACPAGSGCWQDVQTGTHRGVHQSSKNIVPVAFSVFTFTPKLTNNVVFREVETTHPRQDTTGSITWALG